MQSRNYSEIEGTLLPTIVKLIISHWRYLVAILITSELAILLAGSIEFLDPTYHNSDFHKYLKMAMASPEITEDVIRPFVYRILIPLLAGILPFDIHSNFILLSHLSLVILSVTIFLFLIDHNIDSYTAVVFTIIFQLNRYIFQINAWNYFQVSDTASLSILFLSFLLLKRKKWIILLLLLPLGVLVKEYTLIIIPAGFFYLFVKKSELRSYFTYAFISFLSILVFVVIRQLIVSEGGESLFVQYTTQVIYYSKPVLLIKRFIVPFTPFGLIPIIFFKDLIKFNKRNIHFFIYTLTVVGISFFGEPERLMTPLFAVYFLFVAELYKSLTEGIKKEYILYINIFMIGISFLASLYHIWGVILLPTKEFTMIFTVVTNLLMFIVFLYLEKSKFLRKTIP